MAAVAERFFKDENPQGRSMMTKGLPRWCCWLACWAGVVAGGSRAAAIEPESGRLAELIARLASSEYVLGAAPKDQRPYVDPTPVLHAFRHLASSLAWGDADAAAKNAPEVGYEVVRFTDNDTQREYLVLREDLSTVETIRGWGSYIINPAGRTNAIVEVPHPKADLHTPEVGAVVFAACEAKGFLLAGTHREKADVPDLVDSVFHQVHTAWVGPAAQVSAWQIHGFSSAKHAFPRGAKVVASTGDGAVVPAVAALDAALEERGFPSYVFNELPPETTANKQVNQDVPGATFSALAASKNEQGRHSRSLGGSFVHIELAEGVRSDGDSRAAAGAAIAAVIAGRVTKTAAVAEADATAVAQVDAAEAAAKAAADAAIPLRLAAQPTSTERGSRPPQAAAAGPDAVR
jgi:hypothetical protein